MSLEEELKLQYEMFEGRGQPAELEGRFDGSDSPRILRPVFLSRHSGYLLDIDQKIQSNLSFHYLLFLPSAAQFDECLIMGHGFNEAAYVKLFPWAYCLSKALHIPVIIFPLSFHINRRPTSWLYLMRSAYRSRKDVVHNRCQSPFNAVVSQRISENPERFFRGAFQSYCDIMDLIREIINGDLVVSLAGRKIKPFREDTHVHFLGYSISGYLYLGLLLLHGQGILRNSRCLLFSSCASGEDINPVSILVIDQEAFEKALKFYGSGHKRQASTEFLRWFYETEAGQCFQSLFLEAGKEKLHECVQKLVSRLAIIADPKDSIFPLEGIVRNLGKGIPTLILDLGRHEFPFNISELEGRESRAVISEIRNSYAPSPIYWTSFRKWLGWTTTFFMNSIKLSVGHGEDSGI